ncbi:quinone oxidoreductase [Komagataeibacter sp. AV436]|uniref:Quinone oxidoreductase n=1 Tax=Komagataeibacter melomenusus TaxID=2766578 RepID=A0ABX2ABS3_9PROT|nr:quinone oxidoreductase [Komagataeibacter melomenusus]MBV1829557.1 quinone oxidoreductase [Komagataeibacter melomenusus]NPC65287.1 quinone oxidoreductase [Komagataeibacter melomenusus]
MNTIIRVHDYGGPDVLRVETLPEPTPGPGEIVLRQEAIGVNFIDTYFRSGLYKFPALPAIPGMEGAGTITAVGAGVTGLQAGMRVAYPATPGGYAALRTIAADRVVVLPADITAQTAAAMMLRGLSVHMLLRAVYSVQPGDDILVYAAAGGVGLLMCQWARHLGARVIGVVSTPEKAALAKANGAADVIIGTDNVVEQVRTLTEGRMLPVVYDSLGKATFETSLSCLRPRGLMVSYGNATGAVTGVDVGTLASHGSLYLTRPLLMTYIAQRAALEHAAHELFALVEKGVLTPRIGQSFALKDAAQAHTALESRKTTGSTILLP